MQPYNRYIFIAFVTAVFLHSSTQAMADRSGYSSAGDLIEVGGTIVSTSSDSFYLDYGESLIMVEMDGWEWYEEHRSMIDGDDVIVYGRMDDELISRETIKATSIYVEGLNTYYYSGTGEQDFNPRAISYALPVVNRGHQINVTGTVADIDGREITLETGSGGIRVETSGMIYNPLDSVGYQRIQTGDRVAVASRLRLDFFKEKKLEAEAIISLIYEPRKIGN